MAYTIDPITARIALIAAVMMHVETGFSIHALGIRMNNPGNIEDSQGHYRNYPNMLAGWMAMLEDIAANEGHSLHDFVFKYAPPTENDTPRYLDELVTVTGIPSTDTI